MELFNDRQASSKADGDDDRELSRTSLRDANRRLRQNAPDYRKADVDRKIRTAAVQRHRARKSGQDNPGTVGSYVSFITGSDDGCFG